jgi:SAM-dependent methyltransferase
VLALAHLASRRRQRRPARIMTDADPIDMDRPPSHLASEEKAKRSESFGGVASDYERYRPGPPIEAVDWILPNRVKRVVDLGAGTGALSRLLVSRAEEVIAVEPDERMRSLLADQLPGIRAVMGRGESMPIPDSSVDAVLASSSWHWMDPLPTVHEVARILVPGGTLGPLWSGPDPEGPFLVQAQALLRMESQDGDLGSLIMGDARRPTSKLEIPVGVGFEQPEHQVFTWDVALNADELIGLLGTFSWIITMPADQRQHVVAEARRLLQDLLGVDGETTVDVAFRADAWRSRRLE